MFLIVHATTGALAGTVVGQPFFGSAAPIIGAAAGIASHFVLDMIPHGDEAIGRIFNHHRHAKGLIALALFDGVSALCVVGILAVTGQYIYLLSALCGAIGGLLPDFLAGISELNHKKLWPKFLKFHEKNHERLHYELKPLTGAVWQIVTLVLILSATIYLA